MMHSGELKLEGKSNEKLKLTLCSDGVGDWAGVAEAVSIHRSDHKEVDSRRLQVPQHKGLGIYMLS